MSETLAWDEAHPRKAGNSCLGLGVNIKFWRDESVHAGTKPHVPENHLPLGQEFKKELAQRTEIETSTCFGAKQPVYKKNRLLKSGITLSCGYRF